MRLDLFLKISRLIARRSLAQDFCDAGRIRVNGQKAKSSKEVKPGDELEVRRRDRVTRLKVLIVPEKKQVAKADASGLYEVLGDESILED